MNNPRKLQNEVHLDGFLEEFRQALRDEIKEIEKNGLSSIQLKEGHRLYSSSGFRYQFKIDYLPNIPADTPCKLTIGNEDYDVTVIAFDDTSLTIEAKEELPNTIAEAKLENGTTVLLELLIKRIENNSTKANPAGQRMMQASDEEMQVIDSNGDITFSDNLDVAQIEAITSAVCNNMTFIWEPPGTGKTTVISHVISELLSRDRSVLLVSHTNSAVNGAIEKIDEKYYSEHGEREDEQYPILRLGAGINGITDEKTRNRIHIDTQIEKASHDLMLEKERLEKEFDEIQKKVAELKKVITEFNWIQNTQINTIKEISISISEVSQSIDAKKKQFALIQQETQIQLATHPEYQEALNLKNAIKKAEKEIALLDDRINSISSEINALTEKAQAAKDEIAKYEQRKELKEKEAKYFTEKTLNEKITEYKRKIAFQEKRITENEELIKKAKLEIQQYESKSSIGKFFSSKKDYEQAIAMVSRLTAKNDETQRELKATRLSQNEYETQLVELMSIKSRLADIHTSKTRLAWENELKSCNAKITQLQIELEEEKNKRIKAIESKRTAKVWLEDIQVVCDTIDSLLVNLDTTKAELDSLQKKNDGLENEFSKLICDERVLCLGVYCIFDEFQPYDIEGLENALENAKNDIVGKDQNAIQTEFDDLDNKQETIMAEQKEIDQKIAEISMQVIKQAKVIGTTLTKSYLSDEIQNRTFDTIILDEASMAAIPALWCAAQVAEKNIVIVGDFLQLPPIVIAETDMAKKWLGRDIFSVSGAQELFRSCNLRPSNFVMLNRQFRMKKEIADVVNLYYKEYGGLISNDKNQAICENEKEFNKWYNYKFEQKAYTSFRREHCIHLLDTKNLNAWVTSVPTGNNKSSRLNVFSAVLSVELAFELLQDKINDAIETKSNPLILIVAPYKPHIKWIEQLIQDKYRTFGIPSDANLVQAGTIHSFQGKEADVVIFDMVIDEPHYKAGIFMNKDEINNEYQKMFNVAVSRAKQKLFFVGDFDYCRSKAKTNALGNLLNYLIVKKKYPKIDSSVYFPNLTFAKPSFFNIDDIKGTLICREDLFLSIIKTDIQSAKKSIIIYCAFMTEKAVAPLLPYFKDAISRKSSFIIITKDYDEFHGTMLQQKKQCESILKQTGIQIIHRKNMHHKLIFIDNSIAWIGSLNILSFGGSTHEDMFRTESKELIQKWFEMEDIEHIIEAATDGFQMFCPICGKEMIMAESDTAGYYWRCTDKEGCGWSRRPEEQYPHDGKLVCPKCSGEYSLSMKNEPRWLCENNPRHYRKIRKSDLKLAKMWEAVPQRTIKEVESYLNRMTKDKELDKTKTHKKEVSPSKAKSISKKHGKERDLFTNNNGERKGKKDNGQLTIF